MLTLMLEQKDPNPRKKSWLDTKAEFQKTYAGNNWLILMRYVKKFCGLVPYESR